MKPVFFLVLSCLCYMLLGDEFLHAQTSDFADFPSNNTMAINLRNKNAADTLQLTSFIADWESWSSLVKSAAETDSRENIIFAEQFTKLLKKENEKLENTSVDRYIVLPKTVRAMYYDNNFLTEDKELKSGSILSLMESMTPVRTLDFTPVINVDTPVLYQTAEIDSVMFKYVGQDGPQENSDSILKRLNEIREYIPCGLSHWFNNIRVLTSPNISRILISNDGYYLDVHWGDFYGYELFVTNEGETIEGSFWF